MTKQRKVRSDKKTRVNPPLENETHNLLCRLALACGISKTALAEQIIEMAVRDSTFVQHIQSIHEADRFRVITLIVGGKTVYVDAK